MRNLTQNQKIFLILLISGALIMLAISTYLSMNIQVKNKEVVNQKVHVIHAGGDIETNFKEKYEKNKDKMGKFNINTFDPPINSSNIVPQDWNDIATSIANVYNDYDAFVVICGKETLAYTASAISFMLENLNKPVVFTDRDLAQAILLASQNRFPEVMIASEGKLLRACRSINNSTEKFASPNYPSLEKYNSLTPPKEKMHVKFVSPKSKIVVIKVFPGMDSKHLNNILNDTEVHGIVLEIYCSGQAPITKQFLETIKRLVEKGIVIVGVSQCDEIDNTDIDPRLLDAGVLPGYDMTSPCAFAKISFLIGNVQEKQLIGKLMDQSFRGEITIPVLLPDNK